MSSKYARVVTSWVALVRDTFTDPEIDQLARVIAKVGPILASEFSGQGSVKKMDKRFVIRAIKAMLPIGLDLFLATDKVGAGLATAWESHGSWLRDRVIQSMNADAAQAGAVPL